MTGTHWVVGILSLASSPWMMNGCRPVARPPVPSVLSQTQTELPPAYPRATIANPKTAEAARGFTTWVDQQKNDDKPVFGKIEVLPPVPTLEPYGIGTYQKFPRLPVLLTTGPGWDGLPADRREEIAAEAFRDLSGRLDEVRVEPRLRPTVTIQTPNGLELAWINDIVPGRRLLHGDGE